MHTLTTAMHRAWIDPLTGEGLAVLPLPQDDVFLGPESLQGADWNRFVTELHRLAFEPSDDGYGLPLVVGTTAGGNRVIGLFGRDPIHPDAPLEALAAASAELLTMAGVVPS